MLSLLLYCTINNTFHDILLQEEKNNDNRYNGHKHRRENKLPWISVYTGLIFAK